MKTNNTLSQEKINAAVWKQVFFALKPADFQSLSEMERIHFQYQWVFVVMFLLLVIFGTLVTFASFFMPYIVQWANSMM